MNKIKTSKSKILTILGFRFELWNISDGKFLSVDTKTTRYIFNSRGFRSKCETKNLI